MLINVWFVVLIDDANETRSVEFSHEPTSEEIVYLLKKHGAEAEYARIEQRVKLAL